MVQATKRSKLYIPDGMIKQFGRKKASQMIEELAKEFRKIWLAPSTSRQLLRPRPVKKGRKKS